VTWLARGMLTVLLLGGCAAEPPPLSTAPPPLEWQFAGPAGDRLELILRERQPVEKAELLDGEGRAYPVEVIARERIDVPAGGGIPPQVELGASGGTAGLNSAGIGFGFPLFSSPPPPADTLVASRLAVGLSDMAAYRASWRRWTFRVTLGSPETSERVVEFPAPRPPEP